MVGWLFRKVFGTHNERQLKKYLPLVRQINALEEGVRALSDEELKGKTAEFKERLKEGKKPDDILPEVFAVVRETGRRVLNMRHFDVQLIGGIALHRGMIAEMATGEGKTLVATLPVYLNALEGRGVHVVTVNDYLAKRDRDWMGPVYEFLGLTVGVIQHAVPPRQRKEQYACDITYGTNNEFGFDYLRDNMVSHFSQRVQRELNYAVVDEVDSILIDEARTPLIISGPAEDATDLYYSADGLIPRLTAEDYSIEEKTKTVSLNDSGVKKAEEFLKVENLYDPRHIELVHHVSQALRAHKLFKKDVDYVVKDGEVLIVDEFTGRLMPGRRFSDGLHQALEAKERVKIEQENQTLASVTFQNYFRMYRKLSGMTGTAVTEATEFQQIYKLLVLAIPTNRPLRRTSMPDEIYKTEREKFGAVVESIHQMHKGGRPVLVGTISIEKSEVLSRLLEKANIPHTVLNAKYHEKEAEIIKRAGQNGAVTIATNMAGRGTDIVLGEGVAGLGGLHVLGTERHEARRIDNQLRGRSGRQGDPGSSQFFLSLEDDLMRIFGSDRIAKVMQRLGMEEGQSIQHPFITRSIETAQGRVEGRNFDIRKELLKYDDIMNSQRLAIYAERKGILEGADLRQYFLNLIEEVAEDGARGLRRAAGMADDEEAMKLMKSVTDYLKSVFPVAIDESLCTDADAFRDKLLEDAKAFYDKKETAFGVPLLRNIERMILLEVIDSKWKDHLRHMDELREGIGLRAYGQKDPVVEYRQEGFHMFEEMTRKIREDALSFMLRAHPVREEEAEPEPEDELPQGQDLQFIHNAMAPMGALRPPAAPGGKAPAGPPSFPAAFKTAEPPQRKVGRNEPCPCGSGKKYKKCCGRDA